MASMVVAAYGCTTGGGEVGMTVSEAILALNANVVFACGRAGFDSATIKMIEDALDIINDALQAQEPVMDIDTWRCGNCGHTLEHQELLGDNVIFHEQYNYCPECGGMIKWK